MIKTAILASAANSEQSPLSSVVVAIWERCNFNKGFRGDSACFLLDTKHCKLPGGKRKSVKHPLLPLSEKKILPKHQLQYSQD